MVHNTDPERTGTPAGDPSPKLHHRTVDRPDGPDRCTVFPAGATGVPRMSTWLTVNADCLVDLETVR